MPLLKKEDQACKAIVMVGETHQFNNAGTEAFSFICIVPEEGDK